MIELVIFSKDRALQLQSLLGSVQRKYDIVVFWGDRL
jgi:hypothetical protein